MLRALLLAVADLRAAPLRRVVLLSLALAAASFAALWACLAILLDHAARLGWRPLDWLVQLLGALAVAGLSWLLYPAVATMVMGFFVERVAAAVEALDYPGRGPPRPVPVAETALTALRLMGFSIVLNLLALPLYVLLPGINLFVFLGLNGYLFGREYFEVVALRRLDRTAAWTTRRRYAGRIFLAGAAIAGMFLVPFVNLVAPVVATAFMLHLFEGMRPAAAPLPAP